MIHSLPKRMKSQYSEKVLNFEISKKKKKKRIRTNLLFFYTLFFKYWRPFEVTFLFVCLFECNWQSSCLKITSRVFAVEGQRVASACALPTLLVQAKDAELFHNVVCRRRCRRSSLKWSSPVRAYSRRRARGIRTIEQRRAT